jgi:hypothetical protein
MHWHFVLRFAGSAYIQRPQGKGWHPASIDAARWSRYLDAETLQGDTGNDLALAQFAGAHTTVKQAALLGMLAFLIVAFADLNFGSSDDSGLEIQFADLVSRTTETSRSPEGVLSLRPTAWLRLRPVVDPRQVLSSARQSDIPSILRI